MIKEYLNQLLTWYFSIRDKIKDIIKNQEAYEVLANALYSMSGKKMKKGMLLMVGDKTPEGLASMAAGMGGDKAKNIPANAMQIINAPQTSQSQCQDSKIPCE